MVLALNGLATWLEAGRPVGGQLRIDEITRPENGHAKDEEACLSRAVSTIRHVMEANSETLTRAADFCRVNKLDPRLAGYESYSDKQLLTVMDQLAAVSQIHADYVTDLAAGTAFLTGWHCDFETWSDDAEALLRELKEHEANLKWVSTITFQWSEDLGTEYDRRHPDVAKLPITPVDLGPSNSANLQSVL